MSSEDGTEPQNLAQRARHTAQPSKGQLGTQEQFSDSCICAVFYMTRLASALHWCAFHCSILKPTIRLYGVHVTSVY